METEKKSYELNYLSKGDVDETEAQKTEAGIRKIIEDEGGIITDENPCQKQILSYPVEKSDWAYFGSFRFIFPVEKISSLEKSLKKIGLLRFLLSKTKRTRETSKKSVKIKKKRQSLAEKLETNLHLPQEKIQTKESASPASETLQVEEIDKKLEEILGK
ncbi:MAG: hypothetical protein A3A10_03320 [Candidatus Tagabacteria bacterium RIFCSPLOWO2_01_FULL_42_9]|uniref:Small ribosomal subunit protein bS6 n=1 Tax=Candidatus Tagabacteria bacterium RIFCSPLOWO2_01_FULL_42_9 TaxID=1802296 RepID=A0A1G2LSS8_9BACT|nr:MAG: hypothetical protein A3A10_03320 [Candidatus Tagabacteria bacterium RIFCSPLOWO2_01_FULL_42_9]